MKNSEEPAYPIVETTGRESITPGLTKREYFAGLAMQGLCSTIGARNIQFNQLIPVEAVRYADMLLTELEKPQP